jgi:hypothetical protein
MAKALSLKLDDSTYAKAEQIRKRLKRRAIPISAKPSAIIIRFTREN